MSENIKIPNIKIKNARIFYRNFSGSATKFNPRGGRRTFNVYIDDPDVVDDMIKDGWNVKFREPRDENEAPRAHVQVVVDFDNGRYPPKVVMVTNKKLTPLDASTIECLDYAEILNVDLVIRPYPWEVNGKTGVKAYLKTMYVTVEEDEFADEYGDMMFN